MELSALAMLNPLGSEIVPLTPLQLMPFKLQAKSVPTVLSQVRHCMTLHYIALHLRLPAGL